MIIAYTQTNLLIIIFKYYSNDIIDPRLQQTNCPALKANLGTCTFMQWNKAVIFNEKAIIAKKNCNTNMQELSAFFKAY